MRHPTISNIPDQTSNEDTPLTNIPFTVSDPDTPVTSLTVSATSNNQTLVPDANLSLGGSGANRTLTITPAANQNGSATITVSVTDPGGLFAENTFVLTVSAVNDAPVVTAGGTLAYTENQAATGIDDTVTVTDVDSTNLVGATIQITSNYQNGQDVLSYVTALGISATFNATTGTLTLSGTTTLANYQTALRNVLYANTSNNPWTLPRTVTWQVNDGGAVANLSNMLTSTINVTAVNDPPTANGFTN